MKNIKYQAVFRKVGWITIGAVYLLILVGGGVRSSGSGMGCPDWPKCFGQWIPPTQITQLPKNYKEIYADKRKEKNVRLAKYLQILGFSEIAKRLKNDQSLYQEADFNAVKTWIEYINRLIGVLIGFLILLSLFFSFSYYRTDSSIFYVTLASFVLVVFQGWVGSIVVSTNLLSGMITLHMLIAILIVFFLTWAVVKSNRYFEVVIEKRQMFNLNFFFIFAISVSLCQVILGTQVRELIDEIAKALGEQKRYAWVQEVGFSFYLHRSFSWIVLLTHLASLYLVKNKLSAQSIIVRRIFLSLLLFVLLEIMTGAGMAYLGIPAWLQPIHLLLAVLIVGLQFMLLVIVNQKPKVQHSQVFVY